MPRANDPLLVLQERLGCFLRSYGAGRPLAITLTEEEAKRILDRRPCRALYAMTHDAGDYGQGPVVEREVPLVVHCLSFRDHDGQHYAGFDWWGCSERQAVARGGHRCLLLPSHGGAHDFGMGPGNQ